MRGLSDEVSQKLFLSQILSKFIGKDIKIFKFFVKQIVLNTNFLDNNITFILSRMKIIGYVFVNSTEF